MCLDLWHHQCRWLQCQLEQPSLPRPAGMGQCTERLRSDWSITLILLQTWQRCLNCYGNGNGKLCQVCDTDIEGAETKEFGTAFGIAMQGHGRPSAAQLHNFHFAPGYAMENCTQG